MNPSVPELSASESIERQRLITRHLRIGWWSLLIFLSLGVVLEALHGFKIGFYLNVSNETRRLMWTLAHAHGTLLSLVHLAFAATIPMVGHWNFRRRQFVSALLTAAGVLLPAGFFLGGIFIYGGATPGLGILLVPVGALLLFIAVLLTALALKSAAPEKKSGAPAKPAREKIRH